MSTKEKFGLEPNQEGVHLLKRTGREKKVLFEGRKNFAKRKSKKKSSAFWHLRCSQAFGWGCANPKKSENSGWEEETSSWKRNLHYDADDHA